MAEGGFDPGCSTKIPQLCKYFVHGACYNGDRCRFLHDRSGAAPSNNVCKFYQRGQCSYGDRCRYDHVKDHPHNGPKDNPRVVSRNNQQNGSQGSGNNTRQLNSRRPPRLQNRRQNQNRDRHSSSHSDDSPCRYDYANPNNPHWLKDQSPSTLRSGRPWRSEDSSNWRSSSPPTTNGVSRQRHTSNSNSSPTRQQSSQGGREWVPSNKKKSSEVKSSMVVLKKGVVPDTGPSNKQSTRRGGNPSQDWAKAVDFVPGQKYHAGATYAKATDKNDREEGDATTPKTEDPSSKEPNEEDLLCPYFAHGHCPYEDSCSYIHGDICPICQFPRLHPSDPLQREKHEKECTKALEEDMEQSFAIQESQNKECCICLEVVLEKKTKEEGACKMGPSAEGQFGILENCTHCFCLSCIRQWRSSKSFGKNVRVCPICRVHSDFVTPSNIWVEEEEKKKQFIQNYKDNLSTKPCQYFKQGKGRCPFNEKCFYKHAYPDGTIAQPRPYKPRRRVNAEGELSSMEAISLWDFLEGRSEGLISLEDEMSLLLLEMLHGGDSDSEDDLLFDMWNTSDSDTDSYFDF